MLKAVVGCAFRDRERAGRTGDKGFGVTNSVYQIAQSRFHEWVESAQSKIRRTIFAKNLGHDFIHSWEEHLRQRGV